MKNRKNLPANYCTIPSRWVSVFLACWLCVFSIWVLDSCASTGSFSTIDSSLSHGNYDKSLELLEKGKPSLYKNRDNILYSLDKGLLSHYAEQYEDSSRSLESGERAIEAAFTKSISMEIGSYLLNDNTREYSGEDYEDIYINAFNSLNYYNLGNLEGAMVEITRMRDKIKYLPGKYGMAFSALERKAQDENLEQVQKNSSGPMRFTDSALARYLGMLFSRGAGLDDAARIDRDGLRAAFTGSPSVYTYKEPSSIAEELEIPAGMARLNVVAFSGLSPIKREEVIRIPLPGPRWVKIALPVMEYRRSEVKQIKVIFEDGRSFDMELLEDIEAVARETFKARQDIIYLKTVIRAMMKGVSSSVLGAVAEETEGNTGAVLYLSSFIAQILAEASEHADVRISRYFPAKAHVGGINLEPGLYSFEVKYYNGGGKEIASVPHKNIQVRENTLNLAETICLK